MRKSLPTAILMIVLMVAMVSGVFRRGSAAEANQEIAVPSADGIVSIDADMWEYRPNLIRLKKGEQVTFDLDNWDFDHGLEIPALGVKGMSQITFVPDKVGEFDFYCPTFCGAGHGNMEGKIIVE